jgi:hypothetical protein
MGNVKKIIGTKPKKDKTIGDMKAGDTGYTVPWAYDIDSETLNRNMRIHKDKGGTVSLWVECTGPNEYVLEFEKPIYRNIFTGEYE